MNPANFQIDTSNGLRNAYDSDRSNERVNTEDLQEDITRQQVQMFDRHFRPMEDEILGVVGDEGFADRQASEAASTVGEHAGLSQAMQERQLSRRGVEMNDRERAASARQAGLTAALAQTDASNDARHRAREHQIELGQELGRQGVEIQNQASQNAADSANMRRERDREYERMKAEDNFSLLGTVAGGGLGFAAGGPAGAAAGASLGSQTGW